MNKQEVYKLIENHYKQHFKSQVKKLSPVCGGHYNAEDVVQEAYTRALNYWESFNIDGEINKWFSKILINCVSDSIKQHKQHGGNWKIDENIDTVLEPRAFNKIILNEVVDIINKQADNVKYILSLYFISQYTSLEISDIVPENHNNIRFIIHDFRKKLRQRFNGRLFE